MKTIQKMFLAIYKFLFRVSRGSLGGRVQGIDILILNTVGRKTGKAWAVPVGYLVDNGDYVVAAFAGGAPKNPAWYYNLKQNPDVVIEIQGGSRLSVVASEATGETHDRLWKRFKETVVQAEDSYARVKRSIPVMILHPQGQ